MSKQISFDNILKRINIVLFILMFVVFYTIGENVYVNKIGILLNAILIIQTLFLIQYSIVRNIQVLKILTFVLTFFFVPRIITLNYTEYSIVLLRNNITADGLNYALCFVLMANLFFLIGVHLVKGRSIVDKEKIIIANAIKPNKVVKLLVFIVLLAVLNMLRIVSTSGYLTMLIFNVQWLLIASIVYFLFHNKYTQKKTSLIIILLLIIFVCANTIGGSRSAILTIFILLYIAFISVKGTLLLNQKHIFMMMACVPIAIFLFLYATFIRATDSRGVSIKERIALVSNLSNNVNIASDDGVKLILSPVFDRIAFLDYSTELIIAKERYSSIINPLYYFKSIFDNVLSPGFNLFDAPRVSNAMVFVYNNRGTPSLNYIERNPDQYQSDQLGIYGEFYALFGGWFSLFFFLLGGYWIQYIITRADNNIYGCIKVAFVLAFFQTLINSFGLDWGLIHLVSLYIAYSLFSFILKTRFRF